MRRNGVTHITIAGNTVKTLSKRAICNGMLTAFAPALFASDNPKREGSGATAAGALGWPAGAARSDETVRSELRKTRRKNLIQQTWLPASLQRHPYPRSFDEESCIRVGEHRKECVHRRRKERRVDAWDLAGSFEEWSIAQRLPLVQRHASKNLASLAREAVWQARTLLYAAFGSTPTGQQAE